MFRKIFTALVLMTSISIGPVGTHAATVQSPCGPKTAPRPKGKTILTVWHGLSPYTAVIAKLARRFESTHPGVTLSLVVKADYQRTLDEFRAAPAAKRPDVVLFPEYSVQLLADSGLFVAAQDCLGQAAFDGVIEPIRRTFEANKKQQAVPFNALMPVMIFNKAMFRKAGLDPDHPPTDPASLLAAARQLQDQGVSKLPLVIDTASDGGGPWFVEQWLSTTGHSLVNGSNGHMQRATEVTWNDASSADGLRWLASLRQVAVNLGPNVSGTDNLRALIDPTRPAAVTVNASSVLRPIIDLLASGMAPGVELGVAAQPTPKTGGLVGGGAWWIAKPKRTTSKAALGAEFAMFMASARSQATFASETGYVPVVSDAVKEPELVTAWAEHPELRVAYDEVMAVIPSPEYWNPIVGPRADIRKRLSAAAEAVWRGADPGAELAAAKKDADRLLVDYENFIRTKR
jgi:sn-glycerol 3-phosphate transport system substrate-binding protein